jgi:hypothetical protein
MDVTGKGGALRAGPKLLWRTWVCTFIEDAEKEHLQVRSAT